ncbi:MAG: amidohydrolase [Paenibacillaceae bacterium]|jgi:amidohydrolase|nr:amidohydrolase [Paenibacillaceae bacterium]
MGDILQQGRGLADQLIAFRRDLHQFPELSFQEARTAGKVADELARLGLAFHRNVGGHGIVADLPGGKPGPTIALRADMDALPITEQSDLEFASRNPGVMHACGHDAHTAILLGAAILLRAKQNELAGTVRFLFQSAEEINAGADAMIEAGALEGVAEIYGLHNLPTLAAGKAATRKGAMMGSVGRIEITVEGRGGHGAIPEQSIDPVVAASAIVMALQTAVSRELSPFEPAVVTIGSIKAGEANNVIPETATMTGTVRAFSDLVHVRLPEIIERIAVHTAQAYRCRAVLKYTSQVPVLVNDSRCNDFVHETIQSQLGDSQCLTAEPTLAGEDFAKYLQRIPGCFFWLGSGPTQGAEQAYGLHHPQYRLNEQCIPLGASLLAAIAAKRLTPES